jgi:hypothetical protein
MNVKAPTNSELAALAEKAGWLVTDVTKSRITYQTKTGQTAWLGKDTASPHFWFLWQERDTITMGEASELSRND